MSETRENFMSALDAWTEEHVISPMFETLKVFYELDVEERQHDERYDEMLWSMDAIVKKAIREKVLESYRNGQAAKVKPKQKERAWTRQ